MILKHIPNILTLLRLVIILPFLYFLFNKQTGFAFSLFLFAGISDGFDGWIARHFNCQSFLGSVLDPIADKLLVGTSFVALAILNVLPWWLVILVFLRDLTILLGVIFWYYFINRQIHFIPTQLSRVNTVAQITLVCFSLLELSLSITPSYFAYFLMFVTTVTTLFSYIDYVWTWSRKAYSLSKAKESI